MYQVSTLHIPEEPQCAGRRSRKHKQCVGNDRRRRPGRREGPPAPPAGHTHTHTHARTHSLTYPLTHARNHAHTHSHASSVRACAPLSLSLLGVVLWATMYSRSCDLVPRPFFRLWELFLRHLPKATNAVPDGFRWGITERRWAKARYHRIFNKRWAGTAHGAKAARPALPLYLSMGAYGHQIEATPRRTHSGGTKDCNRETKQSWRPAR